MTTKIMILTAVVVAVLASCGAQDKDEPTAAPSGGGRDGTADATPAHTLTLDGARAEIPAGLLAPGGTIELTHALSQPAQLAAIAADLDPASPLVLRLHGTTATGARLTKLARPITLTIAFDGAADSLCALGVAEDGTLLAWRRGALAAVDAAARTASFASVWLGTFQLFHCGDAGPASFLEVAPDGRTTRSRGGVDAPPVTGGYGFCDQRTAAAGGAAACMHYIGRAYSGDGQAEAAAECAAGGATFFHGGGCATEGALGYCVSHRGTVLELAVTHYAAPGLTARAMKQACESNRAAGNVWLEPGAYAPTPPGGQKAAAPEQACDALAFGACMGADEVCRAFVGVAFADAAGPGLCGADERWLPQGCPEDGARACCATPDAAERIDFAYYASGAGSVGSRAAEHCASRGGDFR